MVLYSTVSPDISSLCACTLKFSLKWIMDEYQYDCDVAVLLISYLYIHFLHSRSSARPYVSRSQFGSPGLGLCAGRVQRISGRIDQASYASMGS